MHNRRSLSTMTVKTSKSDDMCFIVNDVDSHIIIFSWTSNLCVLCTQGKEIFIDGTFKCCPKFFEQLYTMHGYSNGHYQGRIQDLWLGGAWVCEGSGDRLRSPAGPRQSPGRGPRGAKLPGSSGGLRNYRHLFERQFWTNHTIFIRPKKLDFEF